jgi:hypothetical protein
MVTGRQFFAGYSILPSEKGRSKPGGANVALVIDESCESSGTRGHPVKILGSSYSGKYFSQ